MGVMWASHRLSGRSAAQSVYKKKRGLNGAESKDVNGSCGVLWVVALAENTGSRCTAIACRFGELHPHVTYAERKADNLFNGANAESATAGLRYDLNNSSALKFDCCKVDHTLRLGAFAGPLIDRSDTNVFSVAIDIGF